jgi:hypothetical protein
MTSVFISHSSLDDALVRERIIDVLEQHGFRIWYSRDDIHGAEEWEKRIRQELENAQWFLVALSPRSVQSEWVRAEVDWALENRPGRLVPVLIDDCHPQECNLRLRPLQFVDLRENTPAEQSQLLKVWDSASSLQSSEVISGRSGTAQTARVNDGQTTSPPATEDDENPYAPFTKDDLLKIRKKLTDLLRDLKMSVADFTEATMPLQRRIEIRELDEKLDLINRELATRA